jgi:UDP-N-acetylmuramate dehydrogenase
LSFEHRLVVEVDGGQHAESRSDVRRDEWLAREGFRTLRLWNHDVLRNPEGVWELIIRALKPSPPAGAGGSSHGDEPGEGSGRSAASPAGGTRSSASGFAGGTFSHKGRRENLAAELGAAMPDLRGRLLANQAMADLTWFRVGGPAEVLFSPADEDDLAYFLARLPAEIPVTVVGVGSNLLVRDVGVPGVVIRLGRGFAAVAVEEGHRVTAGAAVPDVKVARAAGEAGIDGLAFFRGIPGTIGGALRMNAGAYGGETTDVFVSARALDRAGALHLLGPAEMGFSYRHSAAPGDLVFTAATFRGRPGEAERILAEMAGITERREASQPVRSRTGGSTFKNPPGAKAWQLIDAAGCRGLVNGDAQVSEQHCNFLINRGAATAADIEGLGEEVRRRVREQSGVALEWEIKRIGVA